MYATDTYTTSTRATAADVGGGGIRRITPPEAVLLVEAGQATLVEVRQPDDRPERQIDGAVALSLAETNRVPGPLPLADGPADHLLILYCADPDACMAMGAADALVRRGYDPRRLAVLVGDPDAWSEVGLPVLRS